MSYVMFPNNFIIVFLITAIFGTFTIPINVREAGPHPEKLSFKKFWQMAEASDLTALIEERKKAEAKIPALVQQYGMSIGCGFVMNPTNVLPWGAPRDQSFLATFTLDVGCSGGNHSDSPVFVLVKYGAYFNMVIDVDYSAPRQTSGAFPQELDRIFLKNGDVWYEGREYDYSKDPSCCPSVRVFGRVVFEGGGWEAKPSKEKGVKGLSLE